MVKNITSRDSNQFHINLLGCKNLTFYNVAISAPEERLNTDGIHIGRSLGINITYSTIETGDDCVSIGDGSEQINMQRVTRGPGHGTAWEVWESNPMKNLWLALVSRTATLLTPRMA